MTVIDKPSQAVAILRNVLLLGANSRYVFPSLLSREPATRTGGRWARMARRSEVNAGGVVSIEEIPGAGLEVLQPYGYRVAAVP